MKIRLLLLLTVLGLVSCTKKETSNLELISYHWYNKHITYASYIKCDIYAQISRNGECTISKSRDYENDLYTKFIINKDILDSAWQIIKQAKSDTFMTEKCEGCIYDGPTIRLIGANSEGISHSIYFLHSKRSNVHLLNLFNYIDSVSDKLNTTEDFMKSKEDRIKEIFHKDMLLIPVVPPDSEATE